MNNAEENRDYPTANEFHYWSIDRGHLDRLRMGLLREEAMEEGFNGRDVPEAVRAMGYRIERLPEYGDEEFIFVKEVAA